MTCVECGCDMIPDQQRRKLPVEERRGVRAHRGRGLCSMCFSRASKAGTLLDYERITADRDSLLEDVSILVLERGVRRSGDIAETTGVSQDALMKTLRLAARAGDERAIQIRAALPWTHLNPEAAA